MIAWLKRQTTDLVPRYLNTDIIAQVVYFYNSPATSPWQSPLGKRRAGLRREADKVTMATATEKKHQEFINQYFLCNMNQTEAYLKVYPKSSYDSARANSARLIADDSSIKAEIAARLAELKMSADEVLIRLAEQARGSLGEFTDVKLMDDLKDHPRAHLIKHLTTDVYEDKGGKLHYKTKFELYDAQAALVHIGKAHGLFNTDAGSSEDKPFIVKVVYGSDKRTDSSS